MPKLVFAVACKRAITDTTGLLSIIDVIERIELKGAINPDDTLDQDVTFVTHWTKVPEDKGREYQLRLCVYSPDGSCTIERIGQPFQIAGEYQRHRHLFHLRNMPVGRPGTCSIRVSIRDNSPDAPWSDAAEYPIMVTHVPADALPGPSQNG